MFSKIFILMFSFHSPCRVKLSHPTIHPNKSWLTAADWPLTPILIHLKENMKPTSFSCCFIRVSEVQYQNQLVLVKGPHLPTATGMCYHGNPMPGWKDISNDIKCLRRSKVMVMTSLFHLKETKDSWTRTRPNDKHYPRMHCSTEVTAGCSCF